MADYQPYMAPGRDVSMTASSAVTAGQLVYVTGARTVAPTTGVTTAWFGVAVADAAVGQRVDYASGGVQYPVAAGTVTAGDVVVAAANGQVVTNATPTVGQQVGVAISTATNAPVQVKFAR